jgi:hypothetical protein
MRRRWSGLPRGHSRSNLLKRTHEASAAHEAAAQMSLSLRAEMGREGTGGDFKIQSEKYQALWVKVRACLNATQQAIS